MRVDRGEDAAGGAKREPPEHEDGARRDRGVCQSARARPPGHERRRGDERPREQTAGNTGPRFRAVGGLTVEHRRDREEDDRERSDQKAGTEKEIETTALDREADPGQQGDDPARESHHRLQDEAELRQRELRL